MEEHDDVDDIPRALRLHQSAVWRLIEQICGYEAVLEAVFVAKELLSGNFVLPEVVGAPQCLQGRPVVCKLAEVLSQAATQVKELGGWSLIAKAGEDSIVLWVLGES